MMGLTAAAAYQVKSELAAPKPDHESTTPSFETDTLHEGQRRLYIQAKSQTRIKKVKKVKNAENLRFVNIDGAQGLEWTDVVADLSISDRPGFADDLARLNVALSRPQGGLIVLLNAKQVQHLDGAFNLKDVKSHFKRTRMIFTVNADNYVDSDFFVARELKQAETKYVNPRSLIPAIGTYTPGQQANKEEAVSNDTKSKQAPADDLMIDGTATLAGTVYGHNNTDILYLQSFRIWPADQEKIAISGDGLMCVPKAIAAS